MSGRKQNNTPHSHRWLFKEWLLLGIRTFSCNMVLRWPCKDIKQPLTFPRHERNKSVGGVFCVPLLKQTSVNMRWSRSAVDRGEVRSLTGHRLNLRMTVFPQDAHTLPHAVKRTHMHMWSHPCSWLSYHHNGAFSFLQTQIKSAFVQTQSPAEHP